MPDPRLGIPFMVQHVCEGIMEASGIMLTKRAQVVGPLAAASAEWELMIADLSKTEPKLPTLFLRGIKFCPYCGKELKE